MHLCIFIGMYYNHNNIRRIICLCNTLSLFLPFFNCHIYTDIFVLLLVVALFGSQAWVNTSISR